MNPAAAYRRGLIYLAAALVGVIAANLSPVRWLDFGAAAASGLTAPERIAALNGVCAQGIAFACAVLTLVHAVMFVVGLAQERAYGKAKREEQQDA